MNGFFRAWATGGYRWVGILALLGLASCTPKIGDHCSVSTDCSPNGDRLCDTTQPGGYCTVFNCEPNSCPSDSVCVAFNEASCPGTAQAVRFQRTFCMATCNGAEDCRAGYVCLETSRDPARQVVDIDPISRRICTVAPAPATTSDADAAAAVCLPPDASFPGADADQGTGGGDGEAGAPESGGAPRDGGGPETGGVPETGGGPEPGDDATDAPIELETATDAGDDG